jgi:hypothetical protein
MARVGCALHATCTAAAADAQDEPRQKRRRRSLAFAPGKAARCAASRGTRASVRGVPAANVPLLNMCMRCGVGQVRYRHPR